MRGVITSRDVLTNVGLIFREFGPRCLLRCLKAIVTSRPTTFLDVAFSHFGTLPLQQQMLPVSNTGPRSRRLTNSGRS